jgi:hypothetical protein
MVMVVAASVVPTVGIADANAVVAPTLGAPVPGAPDLRGGVSKIKTVAPTTVDYRSVVPFIGTVKPKREGVTVKRKMLLDGKWVTRDRVVTGPGGTFSFRVGPFPVGVTMFYRMVAVANETFPRKAKSKRFTVRSTTLAGSPARDKGPTVIKLNSISISGPDSVLSSGIVTLYGSVTPARAGVVVARQRFVNGSWQTLATTSTSDDGGYAFVVSGFMPLTVYRYRTVALAPSGYAEVVSPEKFVSAY